MAGESLSNILDYEWPCPSCTYINKAGSFKCFMCGTPKGTSTRQVKFHMSTLEQQYVAESIQSSIARLHSSKSSGKAPHSSGSSSSSYKKRVKVPKSSSSSTAASSSNSSSSSSAAVAGSGTETADRLKISHSRWPRLPNLDRSNSISHSVTVDSFTVVITEYDTLYSDSD